MMADKVILENECTQKTRIPIEIVTKVDIEVCLAIAATIKSYRQGSFGVRHRWNLRPASLHSGEIELAGSETSLAGLIPSTQKVGWGAPGAPKGARTDFTGVPIRSAPGVHKYSTGTRSGSFCNKVQRLTGPNWHGADYTMSEAPTRIFSSARLASWLGLLI